MKKIFLLSISLFIYLSAYLLIYLSIPFPAFSSEASCTEIADTEPHPLRPAPARPCQKEPPKWNLSCGNDAKPSLELELPRTLDGAYNCSGTGDIGRQHCYRLIEKYPASLNLFMNTTGMELPVAGIGSNTKVSDTMPASGTMVNYTNEYLQGDTEIKEGLETTATAAVSGALLDKNKSTSIMLLGDSITQGYYPCKLKEMLDANGYSKVSFVGSKHSEACADVKTEGYTGYSTQQILTVKNNWDKPVDLAIIHLGTNDVAGQVPTTDIIKNLRLIISGLKAGKIILSQIIPLNTGASVTDLNAKIASLASETGVTLVNAGTGLSLSNLPDNIHPDETGGRVITQNYFKALTGTGESGSRTANLACTPDNILQCLLNFSGPIKKLIPKQVLSHFKEELIKSVAAGKTYDQIIAYVKDNQIVPRLQALKLLAENPNRTDVQIVRLSTMADHLDPPYIPGDIWYKLWLETPFTASNNPEEDKGHVDVPGEFFITACLKSGRQCVSDSTVWDAVVKITSGAGAKSFRVFFPHLVEDVLLLEQMLQAALVPKSIPNSSPQPEFPLLQANLNKADRDPEWTVGGGFRNADGCVRSDSFTNPGDNLEAKQNENGGIITAVFTFKKDIEYDYDVDTAESLGYIAACRKRLKTGEESGCPSPLPPTVKWSINAPVPTFIRYPNNLDRIADLTVRSPGGIFQALYPEIPKTIGEIKDKPGATDVSYNCTSSVPCTGGTSKAYFPWLGTVFDFFHKKVQEMLSPIITAGSGSAPQSGPQSGGPILGTDFLKKNYPDNLLRQIVIPSAKKIADLLQQISVWQTQPGNTWVGSKFEQNYQKIIDFGIANNINPTLLLSLYLEETHGEAAGTYPLGCGSATTLDGSLNCIAADPAINEYRDTPLPEFMCRYADGHFPCDYSAHPNFIRNLMDYYDQLAP